MSKPSFFEPISLEKKKWSWAHDYKSFYGDKSYDDEVS
jgi:hypothetical protein